MMCLINLHFRDKNPLSQKLIVRNSRFYEFWTSELVCYNWRLLDSFILREAYYAIGLNLAPTDYLYRVDKN